MTAVKVTIQSIADEVQPNFVRTDMECRYFRQRLDALYELPQPSGVSQAA